MKWIIAAVIIATLLLCLYAVLIVGGGIQRGPRT